jgi:protein SCO1/2
LLCASPALGSSTFAVRGFGCSAAFPCVPPFGATLQRRYKASAAAPSNVNQATAAVETNNANIASSSSPAAEPISQDQPAAPATPEHQPQPHDAPPPPPPETPEEAAARRDREILSQWKKFAFATVVIGLSAYLSNDYAKRNYGGKEKDSTYVDVKVRGQPSLGGPFVLVNTDGEPVSQAQYLGKWVFFYFGFVHCPEICPIELNRMTKVVDAVRAARPGDKTPIKPLFVSCDPKRDSLAAIKEYLSIFHPDFEGLIGTPKQVDAACKSYRVYYSIPDAASEASGDYLIDHSIAIFLFDPQGRFVDFFGNRYDHNEITAKVLRYMDNYDKDPNWTNW